MVKTNRNEGAGTGAAPALAGRLAFGFGSVAEGTKTVAFDTFLLFYYNQVLGLSGSLAGLAILLALCVDAATDPLVGSASDATRSRLGRRHPYMYAAALPMGIALALLFNPPALAEPGLFAWLLACAVGVRVSMTFYSVPSNALVAELTRDYDARTGLAGVRTLFFWVGSLAVGQAGYLYFFAPSAAFADGRFDAAAYGEFGWACGALVAAAVLVCATGTHGSIQTLPQATGVRGAGLARLRDDLVGAASNRSFRMVCIGALCASVAAGFTGATGLYVNTFVWEFSTRQLGLVLFALMGAVALGTALAGPLGRRFGKRRGALWLSVLATGIGPLPIAAWLLGAMPAAGGQALLVLVLAHTLVLTTVVIAVQILLVSMIADAADVTELATGRRLQGVFFSVLTFIAKASSGIGGFLAGVVLDVIAFPAAGAAVDPAQPRLLAAAMVPVLIVLYALLCVFLAGYRITREEHGRAVAELAARA